MIKHILALLTIFISSIAIAQNENSLLWKISGNGLEKPSYIFGTIHIICEEDYFLDPQVEKAFANSEALFTEINFGNFAEIMSMQESAKSKIPLKERITENQYKKLAFLLNDKLKIDIETLNDLSESGIASMITMKAFLCEDLKMYEVELLQKAMLSQKELGGLETISEQMKIMEDHLDIDTSIKMLEEIGSTDDSNMEMISLYKQQNIDKLLDLLKDTSYMNDKAFDEFVVNRNKNWVKKMPELMESKPIFFAVGAAHLGSKVGVLDLLRKNGYVVEAVK